MKGTCYEVRKTFPIKISLYNKHTHFNNTSHMHIFESLTTSSISKAVLQSTPPPAFQWGLPYPQITSVLSFSQICQVDQCSPGPAPAEVF